MAKRGNKGSNGGIKSIKDIKTFAEMAEFLKRHIEIVWEKGEDELIRGNCCEGDKKYRIELFYIRKSVRFPSGPSKPLPNVVFGAKADPDYYIYEYGIRIYIGDKKCLEFIGNHRSTASEFLEKRLAERKKEPFISIKSFLNLRKEILSRIPQKTKK